LNVGTLERTIDMTTMPKGQRVIDEHLGAGTVVRPIKSSLDSQLCVAYMVRFDKTPDVRYNMGENPTMVFPSSLRPEDHNAESEVSE
jgi:hypothetical protein